MVARAPLAIQTDLVPKTSSLEVFPDGTVLLRQFGTAGADYHVEVTTNMLTWREVGVATANSDGYYEFLDTNGHGSSLKFYRFWKSP